MARELGNETQGRNIQWKLGRLPDVYADPTMMRLVLVNLMANALKFTRRRKRARIEIGHADQPGDEFVVFVRDNGAGFNME